MSCASSTFRSIPSRPSPFTRRCRARQPKGHSTRNAKLIVARAPHVEVTGNLEDLAFEPITVLASLLETHRVSSTDLTKMYLARLKRYGDKLHCVVTLTEELALAQAAKADKEIKAGKYRGPLHGIPFGVKDLFDTKGIRTTWGAEPYENRVPDVDATIVERLRDAGAVLCAKLSMGALAQGGVWFGGSTRNPWAPDTSSSGSSAGPGAATAAGLVAFAIGTETRGSIISPSSTCGVVGLRPTYGRVSRHGAMALSLDDGQDRPDVPERRGLRARLQRDLRQRRARRDGRRRAVRLESRRAAVEPEDRLHRQGVRRDRRAAAVDAAAAAAASIRKRPSGGPKSSRSC